MAGFGTEKLGTYLPGVAKANSSIRNLIGNPEEPYLVIQDKGVARSCLFDIEITLPTNVYETCLNSERIKNISSSKITSLLNVYCKSVNIPSNGIQTDAIKIGSNEPWDIPVGRGKENLSMNFYVDGGYADNGGLILKSFYGWMDCIFNPQTHQLKYFDDIVSDIKFRLYTTPDGNPMFGKEYICDIVFKDAYISNISTWSTSSDRPIPLEVNVNFSYRQMLTQVLTQNTDLNLGINNLIKNGFRTYRTFKNIKRNIISAVNDVKSVIKRDF